MPAKLFTLFAGMAGGALAASSTAIVSSSSSGATPSVVFPSQPAESFASGTTSVSIWLPILSGSLVGVNNCQTTILATRVEDIYTYTQGPSGFQYNLNTFSDGFSFIETSSCSFVSSTIASFSMVALCTDMNTGSENGGAVTNSASTTLYPDQLSLFPITVTGAINQLVTGSGACIATATSTPSSSASSSGSGAGSVAGSAAGSMTGSTPAATQPPSSTSSSTKNAAPTHNAHMAAGIGAAALAGLALL